MSDPTVEREETGIAERLRMQARCRGENTVLGLLLVEAADLLEQPTLTPEALNAALDSLEAGLGESTFDREDVAVAIARALSSALVSVAERPSIELSEDAITAVARELAFFNGDPHYQRQDENWYHSWGHNFLRAALQPPGRTG